MNATGTINNQARYVIGSEANGIAVEFLPATQTVDPSSTAFSIFNLLQVRVTVTGNPFVNPLNIAVRYSVVVGGQGSSGGTLKGSLRTNFVSGRPTLVLAPDGTDTVIVDGVTISWSPPPSEMQQIWDSAFPAPPPTPMPVNARATRGRIILNPSSLQLTVPGGRTLTRDISVDIPPGTQLLGSSGLFVSAWSPTPGTVRISAFHPLETPTVSSSLLRFTAPGLAPVYLPVELTLTPGSDYLKPAQQELDFIYTRGSAGPSSQVVPIQSSTPFTLMPYSWDATWIDVTASSSGLTVTPMMTNKPLGTHRTRVQLRNETGLVSDVYVNFAVNDGPGSVNVTPQPSTAGTVALNPPSGPYANGATVTLTATPAPGFVFGRWLGAVSDTANPATVTVNGTTSVTAEFLPATGACTYTLNPPKLLAGRNVPGAIELQTQSGCPWTISQVPSWLTIRTPVQGTGPAVIHYSPGPAASPSTAFVRIADKYLIAQSPPAPGPM